MENLEERLGNLNEIEEISKTIGIAGYIRENEMVQKYILFRRFPQLLGVNTVLEGAKKLHSMSNDFQEVSLFRELLEYWYTGKEIEEHKVTNYEMPLCFDAKVTQKFYQERFDLDKAEVLGKLGKFDESLELLRPFYEGKGEENIYDSRAGDISQEQSARKIAVGALLGMENFDDALKVARSCPQGLFNGTNAYILQRNVLEAMGDLKGIAELNDKYGRHDNGGKWKKLSECQLTLKQMSNDHNWDADQKLKD